LALRARKEKKDIQKEYKKAANTLAAFSNRFRNNYI